MDPDLSKVAVSMFTSMARGWLKAYGQGVYEDDVTVRSVTPWRYQVLCARCRKPIVMDFWLTQSPVPKMGNGFGLEEHLCDNDSHLNPKGFENWDVQYFQRWRYLVRRLTVVMTWNVTRLLEGREAERNNSHFDVLKTTQLPVKAWKTMLENRYGIKDNFLNLDWTDRPPPLPVLLRGCDLTFSEWDQQFVLGMTQTLSVDVVLNSLDNKRKALLKHCPRWDDKWTPGQYLKQSSVYDTWTKLSASVGTSLKSTVRTDV